MAMTGGTAQLVKSGTPSGWPGSIKLYVYYKEKSQSPENNTTTLSLGMYMTTPEGYYVGPWGDNRGSYIGTATSGTNCKTFYASVPENTKGPHWLVEDKEVTVTHKADGTGTAKIYWKWGVYSTWGGFTAPSGSFFITLTSIPRASSLTAPAAWTLGTAQTITISSKVSSYRHKLTYKVGDNTSTLLDKTSTAKTYNWTPAYRLASANTTGTSLPGTLTLETYTSSGATSPIGSVSKSITLTIPNNSSTRPAVSASLTPVSSLSGNLAKQYIQGVSKVKAAITASGKYGTSIASTSMSVEGKSYGSSTSYTSGFLSGYGSITVTVTAKDKRGFSSSASYTINVLAYTKPSAKVTKCVRCLEGGTEDDSGTYLRIKASKSFSALPVNGTNQNTCKLRFRWRLATAAVSAFSEWSTFLSTTGGSNFDGVVKSVAFTAQNSYVIEFAAEDLVFGTNAGMTYIIPSETVYWHRTQAGLALGMYEQRGGLEVGWKSVFYGNVYGRAFGLGQVESIPANSDLNDYKTPGVYAIVSNAVAATLANCPTATAGTLRVWYGNGQERPTGTYAYLVQEYVNYRGNDRQHRYMETESDPSKWTYGSWRAD